MRDPNLFGTQFADRRAWSAWVAVLKALFGISLTKRERRIFAEVTGRELPIAGPHNEAWFIVGRRGGKSRIVALIAIYLALFKDWSQYLAPGEVGTVMILAADRKQARVIFGYISGMLEASPILKQNIESATKDAITLTNGIVIEIATASFRTVRGYTIVAALCDETAFWRDESSANPDVEIVNALRPAMATVPGAILIGLGTPYRRRGVLHQAFKKHFGKETDRVLVVKAPTTTMNPTFPRSVVDQAFDDDPTAAAAEYTAEFRADIAAFLDPGWIEDATDNKVRERAPDPKLNYEGFADPSGGRHDAFTLAIAHRDADERIVLDAVRRKRPPFDPSEVTKEFASILKSYGLNSVVGDRYSGEWVASAFADHGIDYVASTRTKSEIYLETGPLLAQGRIRLLDDRTLINELNQLERRTRSGGRDTVDHPPGGHDDVANSATGALLLAAGDSIEDLEGIRIGPPLMSALTPDALEDAPASAFDKYLGESKTAEQGMKDKGFF